MGKYGKKWPRYFSGLYIAAEAVKKINGPSQNPVMKNV
jgi:hypothetical protein